MSDLSTQILAKCVTKTAALRELEELREEEMVKNYKLENKDTIGKNEGFEAKFALAKAEISGIEPLHLNIPVELTEEQLSKIVGDLRKNYGPDFLLEINVKPELIGGAALSYKGVYKDYSVKAKLDNMSLT